MEIFVHGRSKPIRKFYQQRPESTFLSEVIKMLSLRIVNGMNREIARRCAYLRHQCPLAQQPAKRVALRCFAELVLGTINDLIAGMLKDGRSLHECNAKEKEFVKRLRLCARDIHAQLRSVNCDIGPDDKNDEE